MHSETPTPLRHNGHIEVCICTFRRGRLLQRLLEALEKQITQDRFTFSILVVDNDHRKSAQATVNDFALRSSVPVTYCSEPSQGISLARNKAVSLARGEFLAFLDDDEFPISSWLLTLFNALEAGGVDGVLGPVKPHFDEEAPKWVVKGKFYDRPSYPTGSVITWRQGRTGNVLFRASVFDGESKPFNPIFVTGEDQDFFRRMIEKRHVFTWCQEAVAFEVVPPVRWRRRFMLRRALLRGKAAVNHPATGPRQIAESLVAVPLYAVALPFFLILGQHQFMKYLVKLFDHGGRILAVLGLNLVDDKYVTD